MSQDVKIIFYSEQKDEGQSIAGEFEVIGSSYQRGNFHYFKFEEQIEGLEPISTLVKVNEESCTFIRKGPVRMHHKYVPYTTTESIYEGPMGGWKMETVTNELSFEWDEIEEKGKIFITYELFLQQQFVSEHTLSLEIQAVERVVH